MTTTFKKELYNEDLVYSSVVFGMGTIAVFEASTGAGILMFGLVRVFGINGFILLTFTPEQMFRFMLMEHRDVTGLRMI